MGDNMERGAGGISSIGRGVVMAAALAALACFTVAPASAEDAIIKTVDRKFPVFKFCPLETRTGLSADLTFVAPASTVRITFAANNLRNGAANNLHIDNVSVVLNSIFLNHRVVSPGYGICYNEDTPPGQTTGGVENAWSYDFEFDGTAQAEVTQETFASLGPWTGSHLTFDGARTAPDHPTSTDPNPGTTGSLRLGVQADGAVPVSASRIVSGLVPGQTYIVFAWWYIENPDPLTVKIGLPCSDPDGDGAVDCTSCLPGPTDICGDCNPANGHCTTNCTDADGDGWCVTSDCDDAAATCTSSCVDVDTDATSDCRDTCIDVDHDGYGSSGGAGNTCPGADCNDASIYCNVNCTDADGDGRCLPGDCNDANSSVGNALPEVNDCRDQQCSSDYGYGLIDETSGTSGFFNQASKNTYSWPAQSGATSYRAVRSNSPRFTSGCFSINTSSTSWVSSGTPGPGNTFFYLNRPTAPCLGSWGKDSAGNERPVICGAEGACANGLDDDSDGSADCLDTDCAGSAPCLTYQFAFTDTSFDNITNTALVNFFSNAITSPGSYIFVQFVEGTFRSIAWCSANAEFYKTQYLTLGPTSGSVSSGTWSKWRKSNFTGYLWEGPDTTAHLNRYGTTCHSAYAWCSETFPTEPRLELRPSLTSTCECYDAGTSSCSGGGADSWQVTIKISGTRQNACGF